MFIGHYAVGLAAKRHAVSVSLGTLFLASQLADLIWSGLVLLGIEKVEVDPGNTAMTPLDFVFYPYSHSLLTVVTWSVVFAVLYRVMARADARVALVLAMVVFSHWVLDALSHGPDLPLAFGDSAKIGIGLWNLPALAIGLELLLFAAAAWYYSRHTRATDRQGKIGFWALAGFLVLVYAANILGPPPPSDLAVAWTGQAMWLLVAWGYWIDRHRIPVGTIRG